MLNVSQEKLRRLLIPLPPSDAQAEFAEFVWRGFAIRRRLVETTSVAGQLAGSVQHKFL
jgi:hypothetical protein